MSTGKASARAPAEENVTGSAPPSHGLPPHHALAFAWMFSLIVCGIALGIRSVDHPLLLQVFNAAEHMGLAFLGYLAIKLWQRFANIGRTGTLLVLLLLANTSSWFLLTDDVTHFSERHAEVMPPVITRIALITILASAVPLAWLASQLVKSIRVARYALLLLGTAALVTNQLILIADYHGVHLIVTLAAVTILAAAFSALPQPAAARLICAVRQRPRFKNGMLLLLCLLTAGLVALSPPAAIRTPWLHSNAAPLYRWLARARGAVQASNEGLALQRAGEWFTARPEGVAQPAPTYPALVDSPVLLLITIDALRADVIDGRHDAVLPNLAQLRTESIWFDNARSPGSLTKVAVTSVFMGKYFSQQYWSVNERGSYGVLLDTTRRFPEDLRARGIVTVNVRSINWLRNGSHIVKGFSEDYRARSKRQKYTPAKPVVDRIIKRLALVKQAPLFLHTHLADAHAPYTLGSRKGTAYERYLSEVQLIDRQLGRILRALKKYGLDQRAIIIIQADHGEAFGEHGTHTHGTTLYDEAIHVPLLIKVPGRSARRIPDLVTTIDVGPTILELFRLPIPGHFMGQSLVPYLKGDSPRLTRPVAAENRLQRAMLFENGIKVIYDIRSDTAELYDLSRDPKELTDLSDNTALLEEHLATLKAFFEVHRFKDYGYSPPFIR